ncbi:MAG: nucleoid-associated protein, YbaB/EbfC family [Chlamydiae bacterium GWC2_50_10]|nr:MAG: nucleoid-associated protein, YbaB/EbfC family [Chlamydiae bacterium GWA2_50_15]OGN54053.1 MAG: nucleoid-associated protein, YbaB/EbfC family [Chlamydiae bacterium GWC2_50_10]OGN54884.1 MAG: nucleoid-associated protein, YbaB/EbfC family [Chlamydiae bacterium GWF2_49_8]OGN58641.1 MAG: nucleoid-associated protein, YbaB/EbfC family [Chlamydiae bacterium RIFCSPHIGHO2_02_FULL_49_29]OGN63849.1 MAG: nucleoid-associated protein, YbaB/EbfC family [Chlamydiae bacterium RIFCSPHIGHO2_12_FULL_49_32]
MGSGFSKQKKQMKQFQEQMAQLQEEMDATEVEGMSGNGLITVKLNGNKMLKKIMIKPDCVDPEDIEGLEDLIQAAFENAFKKLEEKESNLSLPSGFNLPF